MAKLFRQAFRPKTHDEGDTAMRELGATGVFQNAVFQEMNEEMVPALRNLTRLKKELPSSSGNESSSNSESQSPARKDIVQSAEMWATPPVSPSAAMAARRSTQQGALICGQPSASGKRAASTSACQTPKAHRLSLLKMPRQVTEVEEIAAGGTDPKENSTTAEADGVVQDNGCGTEIVVAASPWVLQPASPAARGCKPSVVRLWEEEVKRLLAAGRAEDAMRWAAPSDGMIRCTMRRVKNFVGHTQAYHLFLDNGDTFVLAARKRKKSANSNYVLSTSQDDLGRDSEHRIAKLHANFVGTEYSLMSRGCSAATAGCVAGSQGNGNGGARLTNDGASGGAAVRPVSPAEESSAGTAEHGSPSSSSSSRQQQPDRFCTEDMAIHFKQTVLTTKGGPRIMLIATPLPEANWAPSALDGSDSLASCLEAARRRELSPRLERHLCMLATRPPEWDSTLKAYTLDFHGRVRASSVKNFQIVHWDHNTDRKGADMVLQFGKVEEGSEDFALDFAYPLTLQKAFAIALASTDAKLCYAL